MSLSEEQIKTVLKYTDKKYINQKELIAYLSSHDSISSEIFDLSSNVKQEPFKLGQRRTEKGYDEALTFENKYFEEVPVDKFIRRIPFYYYVPKEAPYGRRIHTTSPHGNPNYSLENYYDDLEFMLYKLNLSLDVIFNYPVEQSVTPRERNFPENRVLAATELAMPDEITNLYNQYVMFPQWGDYLRKCYHLGWADYTPKHFITAYNFALEACHENPIIYKPMDVYGVNFYREGKYFSCNGFFPCDNDNNVILRWTNIKAENIAAAKFIGENSWYGELRIEILPDTKISAYGMGEYAVRDEEEEYADDELVPIYTGPKNLTFNESALKEARLRYGYTQADVAKAIDVSERTYQKWELGQTIPDGYNLIKLMNWLNIDSVAEFTVENNI